jgi:hypothetical protein
VESNRIKDLAKFDVCEEFADFFNLSVEYVWTEFVNPNYAEYDDVVNVLKSYNFPNSSTTL